MLTLDLCQASNALSTAGQEELERLRAYKVTNEDSLVHH